MENYNDNRWLDDDLFSAMANTPDQESQQSEQPLQEQPEPQEMNLPQVVAPEANAPHEPPTRHNPDMRKDNCNNHHSETAEVPLNKSTEKEKQPQRQNKPRRSRRNSRKPSQSEGYLIQTEIEPDLITTYHDELLSELRELNISEWDLYEWKNNPNTLEIFDTNFYLKSKLPVVVQKKRGTGPRYELIGGIRWHKHYESSIKNKLINKDDKYSAVILTKENDDKEIKRIVRAYLIIDIKERLSEISTRTSLGKHLKQALEVLRQR